MNTTRSEFAPRTFVSTVIRVTKERSSTCYAVALTSDLAPLISDPCVEYLRTGRTDGAEGLPSQLLAHQLETLVGHQVQFTVAREPDGHVTRITGVRDLGSDPDFDIDDPRTPAPEPFVRTPLPVESTATEVEFTGTLTEVYDIDGTTVAIRLDINTDRNLLFIVDGNDDEAQTIRSCAESLIGQTATVAGVATHPTSDHGAELLLTRIYED